MWNKILKWTYGFAGVLSVLLLLLFLSEGINGIGSLFLLVFYTITIWYKFLTGPDKYSNTSLLLLLIWLLSYIVISFSMNSCPVYSPCIMDGPCNTPVCEQEQYLGVLSSISIYTNTVSVILMFISIIKTYLNKRVGIAK